MTGGHSSEGGGGRPLDADECVRAGMYWFGRGDITAAEAWWRRALHLDPAHARARECLKALERERVTPGAGAETFAPGPGVGGPLAAPRPGSGLGSELSSAGAPVNGAGPGAPGTAGGAGAVGDNPAFGLFLPAGGFGPGSPAAGLGLPGMGGGFAGAPPVTGLAAPGGGGGGAAGGPAAGLGGPGLGAGHVGGPSAPGLGSPGAGYAAASGLGVPGLGAGYAGAPVTGAPPAVPGGRAAGPAAGLAVGGAAGFAGGTPLPRLASAGTGPAAGAGPSAVPAGLAGGDAPLSIDAAVWALEQSGSGDPIFDIDINLDVGLGDLALDPSAFGAMPAPALASPSSPTGAAAANVVAPPSQPAGALPGGAAPPFANGSGPPAPRSQSATLPPPGSPSWSGSPAPATPSPPRSQSATLPPPGPPSWSGSPAPATPSPPPRATAFPRPPSASLTPGPGTVPPSADMQAGAQGRSGASLDAIPPPRRASAPPPRAPSFTLPPLSVAPFGDLDPPSPYVEPAPPLPAASTPWDDGPSRTSVVTVDDTAAAPGQAPIPDFTSAVADEMPLAGPQSIDLFAEDDVIRPEPVGQARSFPRPAQAPSWSPGATSKSIDLPIEPPAPAADIDITEPVEMADSGDAARGPKTPEQLLADARDRFQLHDFAGAVELLEGIAEQDPGHAEARKLLVDARANLTKMYESKLGGLDRVPRVLISSEELIWLNMNHRAGFILSQIDGLLSYDDIIALSGMQRLDTLRILAELIQEHVIGAE